MAEENQQPPADILTSEEKQKANGGFVSSEIKARDDEIQEYIIFMGALPEDEVDYDPVSHHRNILGKVLNGRAVEEALTWSYTRSFNGFAAKLTTEEYQKISGMKEEIVSVFPSELKWSTGA